MDIDVGALAEAYYRGIVLLVELCEALVAGLAFVACGGVRVQVVGVDLGGEEVERAEALLGIYDGHIVGGADAACGHIGAGAAAHIAHAAGEHRLADAA